MKIISKQKDEKVSLLGEEEESNRAAGVFIFVLLSYPLWVFFVFTVKPKPNKSFIGPQTKLYLWALGPH